MIVENEAGEEEEEEEEEDELEKLFKDKMTETEHYDVQVSGPSFFFLYRVADIYPPIDPHCMSIRTAALFAPS